MSPGRGVTILEDGEGSGEPAGKGDRVVYNVRLFLNRGDEVPLDERQAPGVPAGKLRVRVVGGRTLVDHAITLGRREAIAGIEQALLGMRAGGYRRARIGPHLAYGERGVPGLVPAQAVLVAEIWLREIA